MNFTELKAELLARGFNPLGDTRAGQLINWAKAELDEANLWGYREKSATGTAPMTVGDLGIIEAVTDETHHVTLEPSTWLDLLNSFGDLSTSGTPQYWYKATETTVATYPTSTSVTVGVQYWRVTADLTGTDTPLAPTRWHRLYVDIAARMAYRDNDNHQAAEALQVQIDRDLGLMRDQLLAQVQGPAKYVRAVWSGDF